MLTSKNITKSQTEKILKLFEDYTRLDVAARLGDNLESCDLRCLTHLAVEKMDELRELVFGTDDMVKLGFDWGILKPRTKKKKKRKKKL